MVFKAFVMLSGVAVSQLLAQEATHPIGDRWRSAYYSDLQPLKYHYTHWSAKSVDEKIAKQFYIAYVQYRMGDVDLAAEVFRLVDGIIEDELINPSSKQ